MFPNQQQPVAGGVIVIDRAIPPGCARNFVPEFRSGLIVDPEPRFPGPKGIVTVFIVSEEIVIKKADLFKNVSPYEEAAARHEITGPRDVIESCVGFVHPPVRHRCRSGVKDPSRKPETVRRNMVIDLRSDKACVNILPGRSNERVQGQRIHHGVIVEKKDMSIPFLPCPPETGIIPPDEAAILLVNDQRNARVAGSERFHRSVM